VINDRRWLKEDYMRKLLFLLLFFASACAPLAPAPNHGETFQPPANKALIYIVRPVFDSLSPAPLSLDGIGILSTFRGTYFRWEIAPGIQRVETSGSPSSAVTIHAEAGGIYFVRHTTVSSSRTGLISSVLTRVDAPTGRRLVLEAQPL
jgi:hypothetical protein